MAIFWLIIGAVAGSAVAWGIMTWRYANRLSEARTTAETIRSQSQARIASLEYQVSSRDLEISDLKAGRAAGYAGRVPGASAEPPAAGEQPRTGPPARPQEPAGSQAARTESAASETRPGSTASAQPQPPARVSRGSTPTTPPAPRKTDDLTRINGIGKVLCRKLREQGITTFRQIAELTPADVERVTKVLAFPGRIEREKWVEQAKAILAQTPSTGSSDQPRER